MPKLTKDARWWIAINGYSCAICSFPMEAPTTSPVAQQLLGFPTYEEAVEAQRVCLHDSLEDQRRFMERMRPDVATGRVRVIEPRLAEPQTFGSTLWMEGSQIDAIAECFTD